ncbi:TPA: hypothetical protein O4831_002806 [Staphylococcus aureus]|nr:hypothetical protein [Staphylococcus aureus]HDA3231095.1 hypothetical protein [Staphylococcus aureus]HDA5999588.1 hypothetical protein [Staphylococcus aureus]
MKKFNVQITYAGMIEETIEAESLEEAEIEADFIAIFEASFNYDDMFNSRKALTPVFSSVL